MAIKYVVLEEEKKVIAILNNTSNDAYNKAMKMCRELGDRCPNIYICPNLNKMRMPNVFRAIVTCDPEDEFNAETGKDIAKRICLENYYRSLDKRIDKFVGDLETIGVRVRNMPNRGMYSDFLRKTTEE
jgi:hypothetical protein